MLGRWRGWKYRSDRSRPWPDEFPPPLATGPLMSGTTMREPYVFPLGDSPFSPDVPPLQRRRRVLEVGAEVVTDEAGMVIDFMSEDDVEAVLNDPRFASVALPTLHLSGVSEGPLFDLWTDLMFAKDATEHRRIRGVVAGEFTPRAIAERRRAIEGLAAEMCDRLGGTQSTDLWSSFAVPFSAGVACHLVGLPAIDANRAAVWAFDLARAFFPFMSAHKRDRAERAAVEFLAYIDELVLARRAQPADDIVSRLLTGDAATQLSERETRALAANMVFAGLEATAKSISTGIYHLLLHGRFAELADHAELIPTAVLELLRFAPPAQGVARFAPAAMVCQEVQLKAGQVVTANIVAACRDPRRYADPDSLDLGRAPGKQLPFGAGAHYCLGAHLAKLELAVAITALATRFPRMALAGSGEPVDWDYEGFAGVVRLDVDL
jgi:cytochrome P450